MATVTRFEELGAWQKARHLVQLVYELTNGTAFARDFAMRDQIRRAAVSIPSNIAEGFERSGRAEFLQFLSIAKGSAGEVRTQLYLALDQGYLTQTEFDELQTMTESTSETIAGLMRYLKQSPVKGEKFKRTASSAPPNVKR
jgi:four helix bundle protein